MGTKVDKTHDSDIARAVHEMMSHAHEASVVSKATLESFEPARIMKVSDAAPRKGLR